MKFLSKGDVVSVRIQTHDSINCVNCSQNLYKIGSFKTVVVLIYRFALLYAT